MSKETPIQWCDSDVNPSSGCDGCELWNGRERICYAGNFQENRLSKSLPLLYATDFKEVRLIPGRVAKAAAWSDLSGTDRPDKPWLNGMPRVIFISNMADALSKAVPFEYLKSEIIDNVTSTKGRRHIWMWLTKQAKRMEGFSGWLKERGIDWPDNLWAGVSVTGPKTLWRVISLLGVGGKSTIRFVSAEPLKDAIDLTRIKLVRPRRKHTRQHVMASVRGWCEENGVETLLHSDEGRGPLIPVHGPTTEINALAGQTTTEDGFVFDGAPRIRMVIIGGASQQKNEEPWEFDIHWAYHLLVQCRREKVAAFVKQLGAHVADINTTSAMHFEDEQCWPKDTKTDYHRVLLKDSHGGDWKEWPQDLRVRAFPQLQPLTKETLCLPESSSASN